MKTVNTFLLILTLLNGSSFSQSVLSVYVKQNSDASKVVEIFNSFPEIKEVISDKTLHTIYVKEGEELSYNKILSNWKLEHKPEINQVNGKIKVIMKDEYAGKFDADILNHLKSQKNKVQSAELISKGTFEIQFKDPGVSKTVLLTSYFGRQLKPIPNPLKLETIFTDIVFLP